MSDMTEAMAAARIFGVLAIVLVIYLVILGLGLANYIIQSLALYTIADRRRIHNAWLAWIPYGTLWIIGSIVDCHDRQKGCEKKWRKILLTLGMGAVIGIIVIYILMIAFGVFMAISGEEPELSTLLGLVIPVYIALFAMVVVATAASMCQAVCVYKIFEELAPAKAVKYFLLYLLVPLAGPICLMKCRNSEVGIPPAPQPFYYPPYNGGIPPFQGAAEYPAAEVPAEEPETKE